eukprot:14265303-Ditylum_brightwellii.AAC.1
MESLVVPFEIMRHGIETDLSPVCLGGTGSMILQDEAFLLEWDEKGKKGRIHDGVTLEEWRKRLALLPEKVVKKTLSNCTDLYFNVEVENRQDQCQHFKYRFPGIRYPRPTETVASDTFFSTVKTRRGKTCSQVFVGLESDRREVHLLKTGRYNGMAVQDYLRNMGVPSILKTDTAQSEVGRTWSDHCCHHCIKQKNTEPDHP